MFIFFMFYMFIFPSKQICEKTFHCRRQKENKKKGGCLNKYREGQDLLVHLKQREVKSLNSK
jgi:hypothetical protein